MQQEKHSHAYGCWMRLHATLVIFLLTQVLCAFTFLSLSVTAPRLRVLERQCSFQMESGNDSDGEHYFVLYPDGLLHACEQVCIFCICPIVVLMLYQFLFSSWAALQTANNTQH